MATIVSGTPAGPEPLAPPRKALVSRVWWQIMHTSGARVLALAASMATLAVTARQLGPAGRGVVAAATNWTAMFAAFAGLSLAQVALHRAAGRDRSEWAPETVGAMLALLGATTLCAWTVAAVGYVATGGEMFTHLSAPVLLVAMLALPCIVWIDYGSSILMALDALPSANRAQVIGSVLALLLVVVLVAGFHLGVVGAVLGTTTSLLVIALLILQAVRTRVGRLRVRWQPAREILASGAKLHLNAIGTFFFSQASVLIVNRYRPAAETGYFQLATQLIAVLAIIPTAVGMVAYTIVAQKGPDGAWPEQRRLLLHAVLGTVAIAAVAYVLAPFGVMLVAGRAFMDAVPLFRIMLLGLVGMTCSNVMASQWIGRGFFLFAALTSLGVGLISIVGTNLSVQAYGIRGAAWMTVVVYSIAILGNGLMALWIERRGAAAEPAG
jgi:enterobacterial common antigen flippase